MEADTLLDGLDPGQRRAVTTPNHPLAILAGAGSGKTRVLTRRIAYRCLSGDADPRHVLAVTFTRKAAAELDSRLRAFGLRDLPAAGTFHALAYAQLRTAWASSGRAAPTLLDRKGRVLGRILGNTRVVSAADLAAEVEWARARLVTPAAYVEAVARTGRPIPVAAERIAGWYEAYEQEKRRRGLVDFDDLLAQCAERLEQDPSAAAAQRWRFRHLFVDEYQDLNPLQDRLLRAWLGNETDLCVVGDPNQAIFGWNGADASFLTDFARHHPGAEVVELRDSYRSSPQVLAVAASVLAGPGRGVEPLRAHRADGPVPVVIGYRSDLDEANGVARAVRDLHRPGRPWAAQAVLVRTNAQSALLEEALRRAAVPCRVRGAHRFLDEPEVRDLLSAYGRTREPLVTTLSDLAGSIDHLRRELPSAAGAGTATAGENEGAGGARARRLEAYEQMLRLGRELLAADPSARTDDLPGWLRTVLLDDGPEAADAVTITTFHAAKGLEWDAVHLAGLEAGYVPIRHARTLEARLEEERLLYVAVTRAAEVLRCSWAQTRTFGQDAVERSPSPFLDRIRRAADDLVRIDRSVPLATTDIVGTRDRLASSPPGVEADQLAAASTAARLRSWRAEEARRASVRPTVVLSDRALDDLARRRPSTVEELAAVAGLGPVGRRRHGARLLAVVAAEEDPCASS